MSVASIDYNVSKWANTLLDRYKADDPSFSVHFHEAHWTINNSATSQFLYSQAISSILDDIRALRIPTDFIDLFDKSDVRFFDGCLIVALYDHRLRVTKKNTETGGVEAGPEPQRVVLQPTAETLYRDIKSIAEAELAQGRMFTDEDALELEADILLATSQPLCLEPDINVTRIANRLLRVSSPNVPRSLKRKRGESFDDSGEEDEFVQRSKAKLMQFMNPRVGRTFNPRLTDARLNFKAVRDLLNSMSQVQPVPGLPPPQQGQSGGLSVNTAVGSVPSLPSAASSKGKGDLGKKDDRKPKISMEAVMRSKGRVGKVEDSPVSASTSMSLSSAVEEPKPRVILNVRPPQAAQGIPQIKKDDPQPRVPTPGPALAAPGRVATPVQHRSQTPVQQPTPTLGHQIAAPHPAIPAPQTAGLTFQPGQLPDSFLRQPPGPRNQSATGSPIMAGKRPATPQQTAALLNAQAMKMATAAAAAAGQQPRPNGTMQFNPMIPPNTAFLQQQQRYAMALANRGALAAGQNRFSGALQMARPGVAAVAPNVAAGGEQGAATPQQIPPQQWAQLQAAMMQPQMWQMAQAGRGTMLPQGRGGTLHPQQFAMLQQMAQAQLQQRAAQAQAQAQAQAGRGGGQPKPPGAR